MERRFLAADLFPGDPFRRNFVPERAPRRRLPARESGNERDLFHALQS